MEKKTGKRKLIVITAAVLVLAAIIAGILIYGNLKNVRKDEKNTYLALRYLNTGDYEMAAGYLEKVRSNTSKKVGFARDTAEIIRQQMVGNKTLSAIRLEMLNSNYRMNDTQAAIASYLMNGSDDENGYDNVIVQIVKGMDVSDERKEAYDLQYEIESGALYNGYLDPEQTEKYEAMCGETARINLELSSALSNRDYHSAYIQAVDMAKEKASAENMLLLADIVSRAVYAGYTLDESYIYQALGKTYDEEKASGERTEIEKQIEAVQDSISEVQLKLDAETDGDKTTELAAQQEKLYQEQKQLEKKRDNTIAYKAINSVSELPSVEADIAEAKLYYSVGMEEEAVEILADAADSIKTLFCTNDAIKTGLELIDKLYHEGGSAEAGSQATDAIVKMLNATTADVVVRDDGYGESLADAFASVLLADFKYQNNDIYIADVDDSQYPQITLTINGREEILSDILKKKDVIVKDTHCEVDYQAEEDDSVLPSICFVVDVSGSMGGAPIENAKEALRSFIQTLDGKTEVSIVTFSTGSYEVTPLTANVSELLRGVEQIEAMGGTSIGSGILGGIDSIMSASGTKNIILMTDGQSDVNYSCLDGALENGITIFTVGFGSVNKTLLTEIAERTGGNFTFMDSSGDLESVYSGIGAAIGNCLRITYTVTENIGEFPRYVFVRSENYDASQSRSYRNIEDTQKTIADDFCLYSAAVYDLADMDRYRDDNRKLDVELDTSHDAEITGLTINGQDIVPSAVDEYRGIRFEIDAFTQEGLYDIEFTFTDGSVYTAKDAVLVYDSRRETGVYYNPWIQIGSILLNSPMAVVMSDGTVAMSGVRFYDADKDGMSWTLNAYTENIVIFDSCTVDEQIQEQTGYMNWGTGAAFHMEGRIILEQGDAQNAYGSDAVASAGKLTGVIDESQCTVTGRRSGDEEETQE